LGQNYFSYIADELPEYLSLVFNLSRKKEDNFIAGLSMGGLGAMKIALTYPERFSAVGSFSGLLDFEPMLANIDATVENEFPFLLTAKDDIRHSPLNPPALLDVKKDKDIKIYVACGLQDDLLYTNQTFKARADELGIDIKFVLEDGTHVWEFWDRHVKLFIDYMLD
jgi:putative tributyrin esterase